MYFDATLEWNRYYCRSRHSSRSHSRPKVTPKPSRAAEAAQPSSDFGGTAEPSPAEPISKPSRPSPAGPAPPFRPSALELSGEPTYRYLYLNFGASLRRTRGLRVPGSPFQLRKHRRVVRNRNSGSLGTPRAFGRSVCACLEPLGPPEMPSGSLRSPKRARKCLRKCLQCRFGIPSALESGARACCGAVWRSQMLLGLVPEPLVHSKRLLGLAPKLPGRSKSLSEPAPQPHCFQTVLRIIMNSAWA